MPDERSRDALVEHHGHAARRDLARIEPLHRALAGGAADLLRRLEIGAVARRGEIVVAFHAGAFAGDRLDRHAVARSEIGAAKSAARHQHHAADAGGSRGAAGLGDAFDRDRGALRGRGERLEVADARHRVVEQIEIGQIAREPLRLGETGEPVLRRGARHRDDALGDRVDDAVAVAGEIVGRNHRLAAADEGAQADIVAFGALRGLDASVAYVDRLGDAAHRDGIRRIGAVTARRLDQPLGDLCETRLIEETAHGVVARMGCGRDVGQLELEMGISARANKRI